MSESQTGDLALMRELNERIVLDLIREEGPISRAELARRSHLSRSTISSIITNLLVSGTVRETGIGSSQGGRRPIMLEFNYQSSFVVGVEIATTAITVLLTDLQASVLLRTRRPLDLAAGPAVCIPQVAEAVSDTLAAAGILPGMIGGVGVGVPGPLAGAGGRLIAPPIMPGWDDVPLEASLERALGRYVLVENDANLGALAERRWGAARGWRNVAYIYLGTEGIGSGLILDGRLYHGDVGSAGEIGHITIDEDGPPCRCGSTGCLEAFAGLPALRRRAEAAGLPCESIDDLLAQAQAGNPRAREIIEDAGEHIGVAIASLLNLLNPGCVVLGGGLAAAGELLLTPLRATLRRRGLAIASDHVAIAPGALGADVVATGAVSLVVQHVFEVPSLVTGPRPNGDRSRAPAALSLT